MIKAIRKRDSISFFAIFLSLTLIPYLDSSISASKEEIQIVEIEVNGIDLTNLNMTEIRSTISNLTSIELDKLRIRVDVNEEDEVVHIIIIVDDDDKTTADLISDKINELDCQKILNESETS